MVLYESVAVFVAIVAVTIAFFKWKFIYWKGQNIPTIEPSIPFGNAAEMFTGKTSFGEQFLGIYNKFKAEGARDAGVYIAFQPNYMPLDPEIIKDIMQKDFQHFVNHGTYIDEKIDPLSGHLFSLEDAKWRNMRVKLTPTFTSGKMKMMFQTLADCTEGLKDIMNKSVKDKSAVDIKDVLGRFTTDIIGSCAFGLECNSLKDPDAEFRKYGKLVFEPTLVNNLRGILQFALPRDVLRFFRFKVTRSDVETFFMNVVKNTVEYRETNNIHRKDFMHLLLQLKNRGKLTDDDQVTDENGTGTAMTMNELAAQAFVFFLAGFETSSTATTFALFELAKNLDIQAKLRDEIKTVLAKHKALTYDAIMEMTYMDKVLYETLRKYPPIPLLVRTCTKDYVVAKTGVKLKKDLQVMIPVLGLHHDPEYYPNPKMFDPERFSEENKSKRPAFTYLPFGEGPRVCIGLRFGMMQSKVALTTLLKNYKITLNEKTKTPLQMDTKSFVMLTDGGIWLDVEELLWCRILHVVLYCFLISNYSWMLCEGVYLHTVLVSAFISESRLLRFMLLLGWGIPLLTTSIYAPVRNYMGETDEELQYCWMTEGRFNIILQVPVVIAVSLNVIFLVNIVRVLLIKLRRGPANGGACSGASRTSLQALRATMLLVPLLGLNFLLTPFRPEQNHPWEYAYEVVSAVIASLQGLCVAILFCFCNGEFVRSSYPANGEEKV